MMGNAVLLRNTAITNQLSEPFRKKRSVPAKPYLFGGTQLSEAGEYTHTFTTADHCDSIVTLDLAFIDIETDTVAATIFKGEQYRIGNIDIKEAGQTRDRFDLCSRL